MYQERSVKFIAPYPNLADEMGAMAWVVENAGKLVFPLCHIEFVRECRIRFLTHFWQIG